MAQVQILRGIYADGKPDVRTGLPRNLVPVPKSSGVSEGYLRPGEGIVRYATGPGLDRGGISWQGKHYRVMGSRLVRIDGPDVITDLGDVGAGKRCSFTYSFDRLAIASGGRLYYYDGAVLAQVNDPDLGVVLSVEWLDGMFAMTDGSTIPVTDLADPFGINPLRYGSSEADADPIVGLIKLRNELHAVNRHSTEVFQNIGGNNFPLQRVPSAFVGRGAVGAFASCLMGDYIAMVGGAKNEALSVWLLANGATARISTREIEAQIENVAPQDTADIVVECRSRNGHEHLYVHLPDRAMVYDARASLEMKTPVWFQLDSGVAEPSKYRARGFVEHQGRWYAGDPTSDAVCVMDDSVASHMGMTVQHEFVTPMMYMEGNGGLVHEIELVLLPGSAR